MKERLTEKRNLFTQEWKVKDGKKDEAANKLAQFEDFMEEYGFETFEEFILGIKLMKSMNNVGAKQFKELQEFKSAWNTLEGFIFNRQYCAGYEVNLKLITDILDKMHELKPKEDKAE